MPGTEDGPGPVLQARGIGAALRRGLPTCGSGAARPGGGGAPVGLPPEGARHGRRPGVGQQPHQLPALVIAVPVSVTHPRSMTSRSLLASGLQARRVACLRRALETVEKVVTGPPRHRLGTASNLALGQALPQCGYSRLRKCPIPVIA